MKILITIVVYNQIFLECSAYLTLVKSQIYFKGENIKIDYFIYDNSSKSYSYTGLSKSIIYIEDKSNIGVSAAYNSAFEFAGRNHYDWVILSDQDTKYQTNYLHEVINHLIINKYSIYSIILSQNNKIISPVKFINFRGIPLKSKIFGEIDLKNRIFPINSGLILGSNIFKKYRYNDKAKLDFSDFIFFERLAKAKLKYFILDLEATHSLSSNEKSNLRSKLHRFSFYSVGLFEYAKENNLLFKGFVFLILRASLLNFRYKTLRFYSSIYANTK